MVVISIVIYFAIATATTLLWWISVVKPLSNTLKNGQRVLNGEAVTPAKRPADEFEALDALIYDLGARWSREARTMQFDIEFKAIEHERRRVAKELHDEILPSLARLIRAVQSRNSERDIQDLVDELHETVAAFRDLLGELHPVDLEQFGLVAALNNICTRYARLTELCVDFIEETEDCELSELQQLCVYRAMQAALKMFTDSENDLLLVCYQRQYGDTVISVRCVDKRVSSAEWLSIEKHDFNAFESWCTMAGARVEFGSSQTDEFPCDLTITVSKNAQPEEFVR